jgi:hypothetical protein
MRIGKIQRFRVFSHWLSKSRKEPGLQSNWEVLQRCKDSQFLRLRKVFLLNFLTFISFLGLNEYFKGISVHYNFF